MYSDANDDFIKGGCFGGGQTASPMWSQSNKLKDCCLGTVQLQLEVDRWVEGKPQSTAVDCMLVYEPLVMNESTYMSHNSLNIYCTSLSLVSAHTSGEALSCASCSE